MMLALLAALQLAAPPDSLPAVTLPEALQQASRLNPDYVRALGQVASAEWGRRASILAFVAPSLSVSLDVTRYSEAFFNIGTGQLQKTSVIGRADARYELFSLRKFTDLSRTGAELESAQATEVQARYAAALLTESDFYAVLADQELVRLAEERVQRAREALTVARARVTSGAAVQSDSLQLQLELTQADLQLLRQRAALDVSRLELGRRVGAAGPVDAVPLAAVAAPELPLGLGAAVREALDQGPQYRAARANERAAQATLRGRYGDYLPTVTLTGSHSRFDTQFFPNARVVSSVALNVTIPIWNNAQRELAVSQARVNRDVARAIRGDLERAARVDVTQAYLAYSNAREAIRASEASITVARENYRVQDARYRAGASTILDLLNAQFSLTQAETDLVQGRFSARLALAGLEAIVGRRLFAAPPAP